MYQPVLNPFIDVAVNFFFLFIHSMTEVSTLATIKQIFQQEPKLPGGQFGFSGLWERTHQLTLKPECLRALKKCWFDWLGNNDSWSKTDLDFATWISQKAFLVQMQCCEVYLKISFNYIWYFWVCYSWQPSAERRCLGLKW